MVSSHLLLLLWTMVVGVQSVTEWINPRDTSSKYSDTPFKAPYFTSSAAGEANSPTSRDLLYLFIPGTGGQPKDHYSDFLEAHARLMPDMFIVGISYNNKNTIGKLCEDKGDQCYSATRENRLTGADVSGARDTNAEDEGILPRLVALLEHMSTDYDSRWGQFLDPALPYGLNFSRIVVGGHSQGAGHAAFLAIRLATVPRCIMYGGPGDRVGDEAPSYLKDAVEASFTPLSRFFAFGHTQEFVCSEMTSNWEVMALLKFGIALFEDSNAPFAESHVLCTDRQPEVEFHPLGGGTIAHMQYINNEWMLKDGDHWEYEDVWKYLTTLDEGCFQDSRCNGTGCSTTGSCVPFPLSTSSCDCDELGLFNGLFLAILILVCCLCTCCIGFAAYYFRRLEIDNDKVDQVPEVRELVTVKKREIENIESNDMTNDLSKESYPSSDVTNDSSKESSAEFGSYSSDVMLVSDSFSHESVSVAVVGDKSES